MEKREPPLDLTGKIRRSGEHPCAGGSYGDIYKCLYDRKSGTIEVAVKALRFVLTLNQGGQDSSSELLDSFRRELGIWRRLDHPNIVPFLGTTSGFGPHISMVAMWMPNGTLHVFLEKHGDGLSITDRFGLLQGIASGLEYLHSRSVIHGDLSSNNVLIDETNCARLVDFGFSSVLGDTPQGLTYLEWSARRPGTTRCAAPEQFQLADGEIFKATTKSDVYSFGCIMLQVLSGRQPWSEVGNVNMIIVKLSKGESPGRPSSRAIEDGHWAFIQECWRPATSRLSAKEVVGRVERMSNIVILIRKERLVEEQLRELEEQLRELRESFREVGLLSSEEEVNVGRRVRRLLVNVQRRVHDLEFIAAILILTTTWPYPVVSWDSPKKDCKCVISNPYLPYSSCPRLGRIPFSAIRE